MKTSILTRLLALSLLFSLFGSCKEKAPHFTIEGVIEKADSTTLYLYERTLAKTTLIDSAKLTKEGSFKFEKEALKYPEFYLLRMDKQVINIGVDSTETIKIKADKESFATNYTIEGSTTCENIKEATIEFYKLIQDIEKINKELVANKIKNEEYASTMQEVVTAYKEKAKSIIAKDFSGAAAYYTLFQKVDGLLTFDPMDKKDLSLFKAVATSWETFHTESPRATHLKEYTLRAIAEIKRISQNEEKLNELISKSDAQETNYTVSLPDMNGNLVDLASLKGKIVILDFTAYQTDFSAAHNIILNEAYSKLKPAVEIYQVSLDNDSHMWRNTASNLPWICVRDKKSLDSELLQKFNIQNIPTTFILDKQGKLVKRIFPQDNLVKEINKLK